MDELAAACGCDRRTLYRYFPSKEDLFWEAVERAYGMLASRFRNVAEVWESGKVPALACVRSWISAYFTFSLENPDRYWPRWQGWVNSSRPRVPARMVAETNGCGNCWEFRLD